MVIIYTVSTSSLTGRSDSLMQVNHIQQLPTLIELCVPILKIVLMLIGLLILFPARESFYIHKFILIVTSTVRSHSELLEVGTTYIHTQCVLPAGALWSSLLL